MLLYFKPCDVLDFGITQDDVGQMAKSIPYFRLELLENDTLWGSTYLNMAYIWEYLPPGVNRPKTIICTSHYKQDLSCKIWPGDNQIFSQVF